LLQESFGKSFKNMLGIKRFSRHAYHNIGNLKFKQLFIYIIYS
jgi:hypothetical protein